MQCKWKIKGHENETKKIHILLLWWSEHHTEAFCGYPEGRKLTGVDQINGEGHWSEEEAKIDIIISEIKHKKSVPFEDLYMFTSTLCNHTLQMEARMHSIWLLFPSEDITLSFWRTSHWAHSQSLSVSEAAGERKYELYIFTSFLLQDCSSVNGTILLVVRRSYMYKSNRSLRLLWIGCVTDVK